MIAHCGWSNLTETLVDGHKVGDVVFCLVNRSGPHIQTDFLKRSVYQKISHHLCCGLDGDSPDTILRRKVEALEQNIKRGILKAPPEVFEGDEGTIVGACPESASPDDFNERILVEFSNGLVLALLATIEISRQYPPGPDRPFRVGDVVCSVVTRASTDHIQLQNQSIRPKKWYNKCCKFNNDSFEAVLQKRIEILEDKRRRGTLTSPPEVHEGDEGVVIGTCPEEAYPDDFNERILVEFSNGLVLAMIAATEVIKLDNLDELGQNELIEELSKVSNLKPNNSIPEINETISNSLQIEERKVYALSSLSTSQTKRLRTTQSLIERFEPSSSSNQEISSSPVTSQPSPLIKENELRAPIESFSLPRIGTSRTSSLSSMYSSLPRPSTSASFFEKIVNIRAGVNLTQGLKGNAETESKEEHQNDFHLVNEINNKEDEEEVGYDNDIKSVQQNNIPISKPRRDQRGIKVGFQRGPLWFVPDRLAIWRGNDVENVDFDDDKDGCKTKDGASSFPTTETEINTEKHTATTIPEEYKDAGCSL